MRLEAGLLAVISPRSDTEKLFYCRASGLNIRDVQVEQRRKLSWSNNNINNYYEFNNINTGSNINGNRKNKAKYK